MHVIIPIPFRNSAGKLYMYHREYHTQMVNWCQENCEGQFTVINTSLPYKWVFHNELDAFTFSMVWGQISEKEWNRQLSASIDDMKRLLDA